MIMAYSACTGKIIMKLSKIQIEILQAIEALENSKGLIVPNTIQWHMEKTLFAKDKQNVAGKKFSLMHFFNMKAEEPSPLYSILCAQTACGKRSLPNIADQLEILEKNGLISGEVKQVSYEERIKQPAFDTLNPGIVDSIQFAFTATWPAYIDDLQDADLPMPAYKLAQPGRQALGEQLEPIIEYSSYTGYNYNS